MASPSQESHQANRGVLGFAVCLGLYFLLLKIFLEPHAEAGFAVFREHRINQQPGLLPKTEGLCWAPDHSPVAILTNIFAAWSFMAIVANLIFKDGSRKVSLFHAISEVIICTCWSWFCWDTSQGFSNFLFLQKAPAITWIVMWGEGYFLMDLAAEFYYEAGDFALHHILVIYGIYTATNMPSGMVQFALWAEVGGVVFNASRQVANTKRNRLIFLIFYIGSRIPMMVMFFSLADMLLVNPVPSITAQSLILAGGINAVNLNFIRVHIAKYRKMKAD